MVHWWLHISVFTPFLFSLCTHCICSASNAVIYFTIIQHRYIHKADRHTHSDLANIQHPTSYFKHERSEVCHIEC